MNGPGDVLRRQYTDHARDLPPVAEALDIPFPAAALGASGGFLRRIFPKRRHQFVGVAECDPIGNERLIHTLGLHVPSCRTAQEHR